MSIRFTARHLATSQIDRAYPVASAALGLSLDEWRRFATGLVGGGSDAEGDFGIMCICRADGTIYGMFAYRTVHDAEAGALLECDHLATLDLLHGAALRNAMGRAMDALAGRKGCQAVRIGGRQRVPGCNERFRLPDEIATGAPKLTAAVSDQPNQTE